ncbi:hypothetical protein CGCA056_v004085 [Colletotrichum aenigma]|uniref:uncharacterized protein n=1 Tax=Colletotrichum aenigma TaxID=1215731 RepID=UPI00187253EE|nr:uncharacterized protein CGCA056_v004085 [Colletotrichum aenigma]KAF5524068.1 hypothetical protein CGCA056_v004085 [Colletotrichum aenigma]
MFGLDGRSVKQGAAIFTAAAGVCYYSLINSGVRLANPAAIRGVKSDSGLLLWVPHNLPLPIPRTLRLALQVLGLLPLSFAGCPFYLAVCVVFVCSNLSALQGPPSTPESTPHPHRIHTHASATPARRPALRSVRYRRKVPGCPLKKRCSSDSTYSGSAQTTNSPQPFRLFNLSDDSVLLIDLLLFEGLFRQGSSR